MRTLRHCIISGWLIWFTSTPSPAVGRAPISDLCRDADAVVVGKLHIVPGSMIADVIISQVIKGQLTANSGIAAQLRRTLVPNRVDSGEDLTAVVFLKQDGTAWRVVSSAGENAPATDLVLPAKDATLVAREALGSCEDQVLSHTLAALDDRNVTWERLRVLDWFYGFDSPAYRERLRALSEALNPEFRAMGIEGRFAVGDVGSLQQLEAEAARFQTSTVAELGLALRTYRNPDPAGITELGRIVALTDAKYTPLAHGAAYALHALHTLDTLPILDRLLDSSDATLRLEAMFGFAAFVANFPIQNPNDGPSNRNLTSLPGAKYTTGDGESHFPTVGSDNRETLAFWKRWYQVNFENAR